MKLADRTFVQDAVATSVHQASPGPCASHMVGRWEEEGGGNGAAAPQTRSVGSTFPEETHIQAPTNVLLSSSGNKQAERESFRSVEEPLLDFIHRTPRSTVGI